MSKLFETLMLIAFGLSWPANILKSWRARTTEGKSIIFLGCVLAGYFCGMTAKLLSGNVNYVLVFYIIDALFVSTDICLYVRNRRLERRT